ncbi:transmembrane protein 17B [Hippocampus comes]|uniref:Transmembrane protein 17 n=1 Tax=Hippocampus comes TaxID=109280 RepID=A0A3Q2YS02_HIPCM|nr:PREDICTED: transmembrane protein 17 [Hippocampus comes]XP_019749533.1 PREDICTED: transmembrane protein 17 [Hippocampus comes]
MDLPDTIRRRLEDFSRNVFVDQSQSPTKERHTSSTHDRRVLASLPLQMSLFFNIWFFPLWWISAIVMLHLKYSALPDYYKFILMTILILMTVIEAIRLYLGYVGNLREKVAELAGFWLLSILLQLPQILFQLCNEAILVQPLERAIHIVLALFILTQAVAGFVALRDLVRHTESQFHLRQFD